MDSFIECITNNTISRLQWIEDNQEAYAYGCEEGKSYAVKEIKGNVILLSAIEEAIATALSNRKQDPTNIFVVELLKNALEKHQALFNG
jgi:hypothetical protein|tara:strand:- start:76 stop:342 length:267 start_codon:yes stop_codon:yes gene_type:complete